MKCGILSLVRRSRRLHDIRPNRGAIARSIGRIRVRGKVAFGLAETFGAQIRVSNSAFWTAVRSNLGQAIWFAINDSFVDR